MTPGGTSPASPHPGVPPREESESSRQRRRATETGHGEKPRSGARWKFESTEREVLRSTPSSDRRVPATSQVRPTLKEIVSGLDSADKEGANKPRSSLLVGSQKEDSVTPSRACGRVAPGEVDHAVAIDGRPYEGGPIPVPRQTVSNVSPRPCSTSNPSEPPATTGGSVGCPWADVNLPQRSRPVSG